MTPFLDSHRSLQLSHLSKAESAYADTAWARLRVLGCWALALLGLFRPGDMAAAREQTRGGSPAADPVPPGLTAADWASLRGEYERKVHAVWAAPDGARLQARNPGQQWRTTFDGRGFTTDPDSRAWQWGLELRGYGFAGSEKRGDHRQAEVASEGNRVRYDRDGLLQEWFINDRRGLEHGFTLHERPRPAQASAAGGVLRFEFTVRGDLHPEISDDGRGVRFVDGTVWSQQHKLRAANAGIPGSADYFGISVGVSGASVVVGASQEDSDATGVNGDGGNDNANQAGAA
jgi:hypothetical protein